jgi:glycine oxidase
VSRIEVRQGRVIGVQVGPDFLACDRIVVAAGAWTGRLLEPIGIQAPTPPLKGQIVLLRSDRPLIQRIIEHGKSYLVPREDGRVLVGATEEDAGFNTRTTAQATRDLIDEAVRLCPTLAHAEVEASWAGLRPGSVDTRPYIGFAPGVENLLVAAGHKRAGLQLSAATAELMADLLVGRPPRLDLSHFRIDREPDTGGADVFRS